MKSLVLALAMLAPALARADSSPQTDPCRKFVTCGTYVGTSNDPDRDGVITTIEISAIAENRVKFNYTLSKEDFESNTWALEMQFEQDGSFKGMMKDFAYANGICDGSMCSYGLHPWKRKDNGQNTANSGMFRFYDGGMEFLMVFGTPGEFGTSLTTLKRQ